MGFNIYLTEKQLNKVLKGLVNEQIPKKYQKQARQEVGGIKSIELKGQSVFKNGQDVVDPTNPQVIKLVSELKTIASQNQNDTMIDVTVNGSSTNTGYSNFKKGTEGAKKLNISLAERRRDNLITFLKNTTKLIFKFNFIKGSATMSDTEDENNRSASVNIKTFGMAATDFNVDRDNTSFVPRDLEKINKIKTDPYKFKIKKKVSIEIPEDWVSDYKKVISNWAFNSNKQKNYNLKLKVTDTEGLT